MEHVTFVSKRINPEKLQEGFEWLNSSFLSWRSILRRLFRIHRSLQIFGTMNWQSWPSFDLNPFWKGTLPYFLPLPLGVKGKGIVHDGFVTSVLRFLLFSNFSATFREFLPID
jgi:hypothetical protein